MTTPATSQSNRSGLPRADAAQARFAAATLQDLKTTAGVLINAAGLVILLAQLAQWHGG